ncbi:MAG: glycosyltransferase family 8 protein [Thermoleophilaceae bacterium]
MEELHVSCAVEGDYVAHSAAMIHSLLEHSGGYRVRVHFLHGPGFPGRHQLLLAEMVERAGASISFIEIADREVAGMPSVDQFTKAMWYRIFLPELLPDVDRVLYLDSDTIACDSIAPLWETPLDGCWLAAVTNVFQPNHFHRPARLGLPGPRVYFNSGVLLMNLREMRRDACTEALVRFARSHTIEEIEWPDQDTLNVVLGPRRLPLHPRWNCMNSVLNFPSAPAVFGSTAVRQARRVPGIRHFEGPGDNKPWHPDCRQELREVYLRHRRATPWPHAELADGGPVGGGGRWLRSGRRPVSA